MSGRRMKAPTKKVEEVEKEKVVINKMQAGRLLIFEEALNAAVRNLDSEVGSVLASKEIGAARVVGGDLRAEEPFLLIVRLS